MTTPHLELQWVQARVVHDDSDTTKLHVRHSEHGHTQQLHGLEASIPPGNHTQLLSHLQVNARREEGRRGGVRGEEGIGGERRDRRGEEGEEGRGGRGGKRRGGVRGEEGRGGKRRGGVRGEEGRGGDRRGGEGRSEGKGGERRG